MSERLYRPGTTLNFYLNRGNGKTFPMYCRSPEGAAWERNAVRTGYWYKDKRDLVPVYAVRLKAYKPGYLEGK